MTLSHVGCFCYQMTLIWTNFITTFLWCVSCWMQSTLANCINGVHMLNSITISWMQIERTFGQFYTAHCSPLCKALPSVIENEITAVSSVAKCLALLHHLVLYWWQSRLCSWLWLTSLSTKAHYDTELTSQLLCAAACSVHLELYLWQGDTVMVHFSVHYAHLTSLIFIKFGTDV